MRTDRRASRLTPAAATAAKDEILHERVLLLVVLVLRVAVHLHAQHVLLLEDVQRFDDVARVGFDAGEERAVCEGGDVSLRASGEHGGDVLAKTVPGPHMKKRFGKPATATDM